MVYTTPRYMHAVKLHFTWYMHFRMERKMYIVNIWILRIEEMKSKTKKSTVFVQASMMLDYKYQDVAPGFITQF